MFPPRQSCDSKNIYPDTTRKAPRVAGTVGRPTPLTPSLESERKISTFHQDLTLNINILARMSSPPSAALPQFGSQSGLGAVSIPVGWVGQIFTIASAVCFQCKQAVNSGASRNANSPGCFTDVACWSRTLWLPVWPFWCWAQGGCTTRGPINMPFALYCCNTSPCVSNVCAPS